MSFFPPQLHSPQGHQGGGSADGEPGLERHPRELAGVHPEVPDAVPGAAHGPTPGRTGGPDGVGGDLVVHQGRRGRRLAGQAQVQRQRPPGVHLQARWIASEFGGFMYSYVGHIETFGRKSRVGSQTEFLPVWSERG